MPSQQDRSAAAVIAQLILLYMLRVNQVELVTDLLDKH